MLTAARSNPGPRRIFIPDNHGADHSLISYIGLSGVGTEHKRQAVSAVYELQCVGNHNDPIKEEKGAGHNLGL